MTSRRSRRAQSGTRGGAGGGAETATRVGAELLLAPSRSVTRTDGSNDPDDEYRCSTTAPYPVVPSPKFQLKLNGPPAPPLALALKVRSSPVVPDVGEFVRVTVIGATSTATLVRLVAPFESVTTTVAVWGPGEENEWDTDAPVAVPPPENVQANRE